MICSMHVIASVWDLGKCSDSMQGHFLRYSLLEMILKAFEVLEANRSVVKQHNQMTHPCSKEKDSLHPYIIQNIESDCKDD